MGVLSRCVDWWRHNAQSTVAMAAHDYHEVYTGVLGDMASHGLTDVAGLSILDVGCGERLPNTLLFGATGARAIGMDLEHIVRSWSPFDLAKEWRASGPKAAVKTVLRRLAFDRTYYRTLSQCAGLRLRPRSADVRVGDACNMPFDTASIDVVVSNAVFEHIADVPAAVHEIGRVLRLRGICHVRIHNYYSLSGGHDLRWRRPDENPPKHLQPWAHLRDGGHRQFAYLNRLRPEEFRAIFEAEQALELVLFEGSDAHYERPAAPEGERFLTGGALDLLDRYSRDELLTRSYVVVCRRA